MDLHETYHDGALVDCQQGATVIGDSGRRDGTAEVNGAAGRYCVV